MEASTKLGNLLFSILALVLLSVAESQPTREQILEKLFQNLDSNERPNAGGDAVKVEVNMFLLSLSLTEPRNEGGRYSFRAEMYVRHLWNDSRLATGHEFKLFNDELDQVWLPDFFSRYGHVYLYKEPRKNALFKMEENGNVYYVYRAMVYGKCKSGSFVGGKLVCPMHYESFSYTANEVLIVPKDKDPDFYLYYPGITTLELGPGISVSHEDSKLKYQTNNYTSGAFQSGGLELVLNKADNDAEAEPDIAITDRKRDIKVKRSNYERNGGPMFDPWMAQDAAKRRDAERMGHPARHPIF